MYDVKDSELANLEDDDFDTVLASDISFRGTIKFSKPFMIRGTVSGMIDATSDLVVDTGDRTRCSHDNDTLCIYVAFNFSAY